MAPILLLSVLAHQIDDRLNKQDPAYRSATCRPASLTPIPQCCEAE